MKNNFTVMLLLALMVFNINVFGEEIPTSIIQYGRIDGVEAEYYFYIPFSWKDYIEIDRQINLQNGSKEALNFYYKPYNKNYEDKLFYTLYVFDNSEYTQSEAYKFVTSKGDYTFVSKEYLDNTYSNTMDNIIFNRFVSELNNDSFISSKISVENEIDKSVYNKIYLNGEKIDYEAFISAQNIVYLPIREIAEQLGYKVEWNSKNQSVVLRGDDFIEIIYLRSNNTYTPIVIDSHVYMPSMYFVQFLGLDVNIDSKNNVKINSRS